MKTIKHEAGKRELFIDKKGRIVLINRIVYNESHLPLMDKMLCSIFVGNSKRLRKQIFTYAESTYRRKKFYDTFYYLDQKEEYIRLTSMNQKIRALYVSLHVLNNNLQNG